MPSITVLARRQCSATLHGSLTSLYGPFGYLWRFRIRRTRSDRPRAAVAPSCVENIGQKLHFPQAWPAVETQNHNPQRRSRNASRYSAATSGSSSIGSVRGITSGALPHLARRDGVALAANPELIAEACGAELAGAGGASVGGAPFEIGKQLLASSVPMGRVVDGCAATAAVEGIAAKALRRVSELDSACAANPYMCHIWPVA